MESSKEIAKLNRVPTDERYAHLSFSETLRSFENKKPTDISIEVACGSEAVLLPLFDARNVSDSLAKAYAASFSGSHSTLYEHYSRMLEKGPEATSGFFNNLKGKVFEIELANRFEEAYPDFDFSIADKANQPIWDIKGVNIHDGTEILIQAKMGAAGYAGDVLERMQDHPDVFSAVSNEIHEKILKTVPALAKQFLDIDISNYDFSHNVHDNLDVLTDNLGIDVPDQLGEILPYIGEIILGIRLILDIIKVQRDFQAISATDKAKLSAVKSIVLLSRFGITTLCTTVGGSAGAAAGSAIPGAGNLVGGALGGVGGAFMASQLNKYFKPHIMEFALGLTGLDENDIFYFYNKEKIDNLALAFSSTNL